MKWRQNPLPKLGCSKLKMAKCVWLSYDTREKAAMGLGTILAVKETGRKVIFLFKFFYSQGNKQ